MGRSLLDYLDAAVLVGDPDGRAVYVNPAFESGFGVTRAQAHGQSLAALFEGGSREAILGAVAGVCSGGSTRRLRLRVADRGYAVQASPIESEQGRVGVIVLLIEELQGDDREHAFLREVQEPLDTLGRCLESILAAPGADPRAAVHEALRALERIRKRSAQLQGLVGS